MTLQEYEKSLKKPNAGFYFYSNEKDICDIVVWHLAENIKENIEILKLFQPFNSPEVYEINNNEKTLYLFYIVDEPLKPIKLTPPTKN